MTDISRFTAGQLRRELAKREKSISSKSKKRRTETRTKATKRSSTPKRHMHVKTRSKTDHTHELKRKSKNEYKTEEKGWEFVVLKERLLKQRQQAFDGKALNYTYSLAPYPVTTSTIRFLSRGVYKLAEKQLNKLFYNYPSANIYLKMVFVNEDTNVVLASAVVKMSDVSPKELINAIYHKLQSVSRKHYPTADYWISLSDVMILTTGMGRRGGCSEANSNKTRRELNKECTLVLTSHKSIKNNCLIQCFNHSYGVSGRELKANKVRSDLKLRPDAKIDFDMVTKMSRYYNNRFKKDMGVVLVNGDMKILKFKHPKIVNQKDFDVTNFDVNKNLVKICLMGEHYYTYELVCYRKCDVCGQKVLSTNTDHKCNKDKASYYTVQITKEKSMVTTSKYVEDKLDYDKVVYWDLETFQPEEDGVRHEIYASGFYDKKYYVYYGHDAADKTFSHFMKLENRIITAYNGSGFDYAFLIDHLTSRGAKIENMIMNNGRIMSFSYHNGDAKKSNKIFDLFLFTMCGLGDACKDFKIVNQKMEFEHSKMKDWACVEEFKDEVIPYLKVDVMGLRELFITFNDMIFEIEKTNITRFMTCSHMGYEIWRNMLDEIVEVPKDLEKMDYIAKAVFGGRCYPQQHQYKSSMHDDVKAGKLKYEDVINSKSQDYLFNADASSLYPAAMSGYDRVKVKYPIGYSRWSDNPQKEWDAKKMGFYEIKFTPPTNIRHAVLPRRVLEDGRNVGVAWSLEEGTGVYTSVDIENALHSDYKIEFIGKALVYDKSGDVFSKFIKKFYKLKGKAEKEGNDSMRNIAKLLLNSLYGKMLMAPIEQHTEIINSAVDMDKFLFEFELVDFHIINDSKILMVGQVKGERRIEKITKPRQLGAFVTAYSRRIMLFYMKEIDPTLKSMIFTYTDTDSLHISGKDYNKLKDKGLIKTKKEAELGYLCSDIKNEGVILRELNLAPKTYYYESIDNLNEIKETKKCKGIPKRVLKDIDFEKDHGEPIEFHGLKRKTTKLTSKDRKDGIPLFSVTNSTQTRTFMKNMWSKMDLIDNQYYAKGYFDC